MPRIKRWMPVDQEINHSRGMREYMKQFGLAGLRIWLEVQSIADRNEGLVDCISETSISTLTSAAETKRPVTRAALAWLHKYRYLRVSERYSVSYDGHNRASVIEQLSNTCAEHVQNMFIRSATEVEQIALSEVANYSEFHRSREPKKESFVPQSDPLITLPSSDSSLRSESSSTKTSLRSVSVLANAPTRPVAKVSKFTTLETEGQPAKKRRASLRPAQPLSAECALIRDVTLRTPHRDLQAELTRRAAGYTRAQLDAAWTEWRLRGYSPMNYGWLDWVKHGIPASARPRAEERKSTYTILTDMIAKAKAEEGQTNGQAAGNHGDFAALSPKLPGPES